MSSHSRTASTMGHGAETGLADGPLLRHPVTWVLVADGGQAQVFVKRPRGGDGVAPPRAGDWDLHPVKHMHFEAEAVLAYETGHATTASVFESASPARHMSEPKSDVRDKVKQDLARRAAEAVNSAWRDGRFDELVLVAAPATLGDLRRHLDKDVPVRAELARDLTKFHANDLKTHLRAYLPDAAGQAFSG